MTSNFEEQWERARQLYYKGLESKKALVEAIELFSRLAENSPRPGVAQTYLGSLTALKAQYTIWPQKKLKYANEGLDIMDAGLRKNPDDLEALFIHGTTSYFLPFFFNRRDDANQSFKRIVALLPKRLEEQNPEMTMHTLNFILEKAELDENERRTAELLKRQLDIS